MVSPLFFSQLVFFALIGLFGVLHLAWPTRPLPALATPPEPEPVQPTRHRSHAPKPFEGLTHQPHGALCERDTVEPHTPPPGPPDPMPPTHRRPREVDTSSHCCPHAGGHYRGWLGLGNLRANGHPHGGPWRQCHWTSCTGYFWEPHGTIFHGKHASVARIVRVLACLAEGRGLRATARVFEVAPHTVFHGLAEAAEQLRAFSAYFLCALHRAPLQLDELDAGLRERKDGKRSEDEAIAPLERAPSWGWTAMDPQSTLLVGVDVGPRTLAMAQRVLQRLGQVVAPGCVPLLLTDGFNEYTTALLAPVGQWMPPERRQEQGPRPQPRWMPLPALLYAPVVKSSRRRRIVGVTHRVVCGPRLAIAQILASCGWTITTALVERLNLDMRQRVAAIGRRVKTLCQGEAG